MRQLPRPVRYRQQKHTISPVPLEGGGLMWQYQTESPHEEVVYRTTYHTTRKAAIKQANKHAQVQGEPIDIYRLIPDRKPEGNLVQ